MCELTSESIRKVNVVELQAELTEKELDTRGTKQVLVRRLLDAVNNTVKTKETSEGSAVDHQETTVVYQETPQETLCGF